MAAGETDHVKALLNSKALSEEARQDVERHYDEYKRLIHKMAHKYVRNRVEYEDLIQEALFGLALACKDFDPSRSSNFHTYAIYRMKGKMYEYCIGNENPIYVPTHVAKAASYIKQMQRLLDREPYFSSRAGAITAVMSNREHQLEENLNEAVLADLKELKRKLGNIANNSKMTYENLADLAMQSLSLIVSDDILTKYPEENGLVEELVSNQELSAQIKEALGEKRFTVLSMWALGWKMREIAEHLETLGYTNKQNTCITRQAVKAILDDTLKSLKKMRLIKSLQE